MLSTYVELTLLVVAVMTITVALSYVVKFALMRVLRNTYRSFFSNAAQLFIIVIGIVTALRLANIDSTILLAVLAIVTAGISLALDQSVKDVIGGVKIILFKYYKVGEYVSFDDIKGLVLDINLFSTSLNVQPKGLVVVANSKIVDGIITNHSRLDSVRFFLQIPVTGKHNRNYALSRIKEIIDKHPGTLTGESRVFHLWIDGAETYRVQLEIIEYDKREEVATDISVRLTELLEELKVINAS